MYPNVIFTFLFNFTALISIDTENGGKKLFEITIKFCDTLLLVDSWYPWSKSLNFLILKQLAKEFENSTMQNNFKSGIISNAQKAWKGWFLPDGGTFPLHLYSHNKIVSSKQTLGKQTKVCFIYQGIGILEI